MCNIFVPDTCTVLFLKSTATVLLWLPYSPACGCTYSPVVAFILLTTTDADGSYNRFILLPRQRYWYGITVQEKMLRQCLYQVRVLVMWEPQTTLAHKIIAQTSFQTEGTLCPKIACNQQDSLSAPNRCHVYEHELSLPVIQRKK